MIMRNIFDDYGKSMVDGVSKARQTKACCSTDDEEEEEEEKEKEKGGSGGVGEKVGRAPDAAVSDDDDDDDDTEEYRSGRNIAYSSSAAANTSLLLLVTTIIISCLSTSLNCVSLMTDYWEHINWNTKKVHEISLRNGQLRNKPPYISVEPLLDERLFKLSLYHFNEENKTYSLYLVPMHGGIWTLCISLSEAELQLLKGIKFKSEICINYLSMSQFTEEEKLTTNWNNRMQNVSISCALVCLIILGSAALTGSLGIIRHQLSAILITGVMYLLAGIFALFTIIIVYFKDAVEFCKTETRHGLAYVQMDTHIVDYGMVQQLLYTTTNRNLSQIWIHYYPARQITIGWSFTIGIIGVVFSLITSLLWISLAWFLRYAPLFMTMP